jgi:MFS family permease
MTSLQKLEQRAGLPHRVPFYYGWVILAVATMGIIMSIPGQTMGISVFTDDLIAAFGTDRQGLAMAYMFGTMISSFILPHAGRLLDHWGVRRMVVLATLGLSASLLMLIFGPYVVQYVRSAWFGSTVDATEGFWGNRVMTIGFCVIAFLGVRHFGQGQMTMISRTMLGRWFEGRRGLAFAISGGFVALGFGSAPFFLAKGITRFGWQNTIFLLIAAELVMLVLGLAFFRSSPGECKMEMEQGLPPVKRNRQTVAVVDKTLHEVRLSPQFWLFCSALMLYGMTITAVVFHLRDISRLQDLDPDDAFALFIPISIVSTIVEMGGSYLTDRISIKYHLFLMLVSLSVGSLAVIFLDSYLGPIFMVAGFGITGGMFAALSGVAWPKLFGLKYLGAINGLFSGWLVFACAFSPFLFSLIESWFGSYDIALYVSGGLPLLVVIAALRIRVDA